MTQEERQLLLKDLSARLPYGVKVSFKEQTCTIDTIAQDSSLLLKAEDGYVPNIEEGLFVDIENCKPFLRPMSSMTNEEYEEYYNISYGIANIGSKYKYYDLCDWLNTNHFDYRGLIDKGLAIEAPEGMY